MSPKHHATSTDPAAVATAVLSGCSAATSFPLAGLDPALTRVDYRYTDSSVAPEFHRSYDLSARADDVTIVVDSYGEILHDETASIDDATWQALLRSAAALEIDSPGGTDDCDGRHLPKPADHRQRHRPDPGRAGGRVRLKQVRPRQPSSTLS